MKIKNVVENIINKFNHNKGDICGIKKCHKSNYLSLTNLCYNY